MAPVKTPDVGLPTNAPVVSKEWAAGVGETETREWNIGTATEVIAEYETAKAAAEAGNNTQAISYTNSNGRARLMMRLGRTGNGGVEYGDEVTVIEEMYAVDLTKAVSTAPYFSITVDAGKGLPLSDNEVVFVRRCVDNGLTDGDEITDYAARLELDPATFAWANWTDGMKELRYHLDHNVESYFETAFIVRRSLYGVRTSVIKASFANINKVVAAPVLSPNMSTLIDSLPAGEWLYKPPQAEYLGKGRWRVGLEWHWSETWSVVYGGTWNL